MLFGALTLWLGAGVRPALAHTRIEVGPYALVFGWASEPPIVGDRNALVIQVTEDEQPVDGLEATLKVEVLYAGRTYHANLEPEGTPGWYKAELFPTVRGQYQVHVTGSIRDTAIDETVEPEEVQAADVLQFPEAQPDLRELQSSLSDIQARLSTAYALAIGGLVAGLAGLGLAAFGLTRRR